MIRGTVIKRYKTIVHLFAANSLIAVVFTRESS